jgi:hypothetical protein
LRVGENLIQAITESAREDGCYAESGIQRSLQGISGRVFEM